MLGDSHAPNFQLDKVKVLALKVAVLPQRRHGIRLRKEGGWVVDEQADKRDPRPPVCLTVLFQRVAYGFTLLTTMTRGTPRLVVRTPSSSGKRPSPPSGSPLASASSFSLAFSVGSL